MSLGQYTMLTFHSSSNYTVDSGRVWQCKWEKPQILILYPTDGLIFRGKDFKHSACLDQAVVLMLSVARVILSLGVLSYGVVMLGSVQVRLLRWWLPTSSWPTLLISLWYSGSKQLPPNSVRPNSGVIHAYEDAHISGGSFGFSKVSSSSHSLQHAL